MEISKLSFQTIAMLVSSFQSFLFVFERKHGSNESAHERDKKRMLINFEILFHDSMFLTFFK